MNRYAVNGIELDVVEAGDPGGPAIVLAHGFPESSHSWRHQIEPLVATGYHVLVPDQRGYGRYSAP
jgi:pimeloyl-ACP methyl ester carboxylesterase